MGNILLASLNNTFEIFGLTIHWYGVILTSAMVLGLFLFMYLAKKDGIESDFSLTLFLCAIIGAIIGARLFYVLPRFDEYFTSWEGFWRAFDISEGGLTIMGGIPCGAIGVYIACRMYKKSLFRVLDMVVPCLLLGQVVGRWGNFMNQELYGMEVTNPAFQKFPFAVYIDYDGAWHCANFFYESFLNFIALVIMLVLILKYRDKIKVGMISAMYIVWYCLVRGILEFVKVGQLYWGSVRAVQLVCFLLVPFGIALMVLIQTGKLKLETPRMYDLHYGIVHEPPPYVEPIEEDTIEEVEDNTNEAND